MKKSVKVMSVTHPAIRRNGNDAGDMISGLTSDNSGPAKFYGIPKIHKVTETLQFTVPSCCF